MRSSLPKLPTLQKPVLMPMRTRKGSSMPRVRHCTLSSARRRCMSNAIARHAFASLTTPRDSGSPKNTEDRVADELVDRSAVRRRDRRHFGQIFVEQRREFFRLHPLRARREVDHVREEYRELLALGGDLDVLAGENAAVELRRNIFRNFSCQAREE